jgi:hypothetical protein
MTTKDLQDIGGSGLVLKYKDFSSLFSTLFPEYKWLPWEFTAVPITHWEDVNNQIKWMKWAEKQLNIKEPSDWYKITHKVENSEIFL